MIRDAMLLVDALRNPASTAALDSDGWIALITMARAEQLIGTLAVRLDGQAMPDAVAAILSDARINAAYQRRSALWEAECAARALSDYPGKVVLMKGTAYVAANLKAGQGRHIGDLDIMVARDDLGTVEALLLAKGGWEWVKEDAYDDAYYRDHMHELPPMIHKERDRMIDVHHTILPLTARPSPDAAAMLADSKLSPLKRGGIYILSPADMVIHCATHLMADGDLTGGLRNLWDMHCLLTELEQTDPDFYLTLAEMAADHQLTDAVFRAVRVSRQLYGTKTVAYNKPAKFDFEPIWTDHIFIRCMTARDGYGRSTRKLTRLVFYIRSHLLRMPPMMLARHLFTKWRKAKDKK
jgi:Uncharacterised nucleotidyltransferase